ncbi:MAG: ArsR family transcriptional regulator [Promethearchaeota archaeon]
MKLAAEGDRLRALVGRQRKVTEVENVYGDKVPVEKFDSIYLPAIREEYERARILLLLEKAPRSVKDLAKEIGIPTHVVLEHLVVLRTKNIVGYERISGLTPLYMKL